MKKFLVLVIASFFSLPLSAQEAETPKAEMPKPATVMAEQTEEERAAMQAKTMESFKKSLEYNKKIFPHLIPKVPRITATEKSLPFVFLNEDFTNEEFLAYTGLTQEKAQEIKKKQWDVFTKGGGQRKIMDEALKTDDPKKLEQLAEKQVDQMSQLMAAQDDVLRKELTPEQLGKFKELRLILSTPNKGVEFIFDFGQYETLDLSDEQRQKLDAIREEYAKEFQPLMQRVLDVQTKRIERWIEAGKFGGEDSEEIKREEDEALVLLSQLHARIRTKVLALMTKEQMERLDKILAGAPQYLVKRLGLDVKRDDSWRDSWKPGDPIPEGALPPQKDRVFPLGF